MRAPILLSSIVSHFPIIASIWLISHSLWHEMGYWGTCEETRQLCIFPVEQVCESEHNTLVQCSIFDHRLSIHLSSAFCQLPFQSNPYRHFSHSQNAHSQLQSSLTKFLNIESHHSNPHILRENVFNFGSMDHIGHQSTMVISHLLAHQRHSESALIVAYKT